MKTAVHYRALGENVPFEIGFPFLHECKAQGAELIMQTEGPLGLKTSAQELRRIRQLAADCGLAISGLSNAALWAFPLTSGDPGTRQRGIDSLLCQIDAAVELETQRLLVIPGYAGTTYVPSSETVRYDLAMARSADALAGVLPRARQAGVTLCVENVWNRMLLSPLELRSFVQALGSGAGIYFDVGNALLYGDPELWIELLGSVIQAVHIKDALRSRADLSAYVPLGTGEIRFDAVFRALDAINYDGYYTLEQHREFGPDVVRRELNALRCLRRKFDERRN